MVNANVVLDGVTLNVPNAFIVQVTALVTEIVSFSPNVVQFHNF